MILQMMGMDAINGVNGLCGYPPLRIGLVTGYSLFVIRYSCFLRGVVRIPDPCLKNGRKGFAGMTDLKIFEKPKAGMIDF